MGGSASTNFKVQYHAFEMLAAYGDWNRATLDQDGALVWGVEPQ
jgi:hypothetical protein